MPDPTRDHALGVSGVLYGIYAWALFIVSVLLALFVTLIVPSLDRRRRWVTACARAPFPLAGIQVDIHGLARIPDDSCVVVANHASYIDGVLLQGYLPPRFSYVCLLYTSPSPRD